MSTFSDHLQQAEKIKNYLFNNLRNELVTYEPYHKKIESYINDEGYEYENMPNAWCELLSLIEQMNTMYDFRTESYPYKKFTVFYLIYQLRMISKEEIFSLYESLFYKEYLDYELKSYKDLDRRHKSKIADELWHLFILEDLFDLETAIVEGNVTPRTKIMTANLELGDSLF